jgi:hypothetical protein
LSIEVNQKLKLFANRFELIFLVEQSSAIPMKTKKISVRRKLRESSFKSQTQTRFKNREILCEKFERREKKRKKVDKLLRL